MKFVKYHGLGNDFVVVDLRVDSPDAAAVQRPATVKRVCERRFGIGADGILAILPASSKGADARMRVLNADGSEAEMCGNGLRCVVKHLLDTDLSLARDELVIDTGAGALTCSVAQRGPSGVESVRVDMGRPRLLRSEIPMRGPAKERAINTAIEGTQETFTAISMGNPHAIHFTSQSGAKLRRLAELIGPRVETNSAFPARTNVEFARSISATEIELVVWERGCGITLACGTGACATVVAACLEGRARPGETVTVHLLGGDLEIMVDEQLERVLMSGPAVRVYAGTFDAN